MTEKALLEDMAASLRSTTTHQTGKTILITGSNSGIGLYASKLLYAMSPMHRLILVARSMEKAEYARKQIMMDDPVSSSIIIPMACDQSSLQSIHDFCAELRRKFDNDAATIDALCLNAATLAKTNEPEFTEDGMEVTFQTNHLAPFLISNLIHDLIDPQGRIVVTGSGLHRGPTFESFCGMTEAPNSQVAKKGFATINGSDFQYKASYAASKLCNMAFTLALNRRLQKEVAGTRVANCFTPGLIPESGLFRNQNPYLLMAFSFVMKHVVKGSTTVEWGGGALAWMAISDEAGKQGGEYWAAPMGASRKGAKYGNEFCPSEIAEEALNEENQERLWELSAQLANIPGTTL